MYVWRRPSRRIAATMSAAPASSLPPRRSRASSAASLLEERVIAVNDDQYAVARGSPPIRSSGRRIPVYALPPGSLRPLVPARDDPGLDRVLRSLAEGVTADVGVYVHRADGDAAAWNTGAEFEGARPGRRHRVRAGADRR